MNERPHWDKTFIEICHIISKRSTCLKKQVGSIVVKENNILSIGYNGTPSGEIHCDKYWKNFCADFRLPYKEFLSSDTFSAAHRQWSLYNELHAEMNALAKCKENLEGGIVYTTLSPCIMCAKYIVASKIKRVVYQKENSKDIKEIEFFLKSNKIQLQKIQ